MNEQTEYILHSDNIINKNEEIFQNNDAYLPGGTMLMGRYRIREVIGEGGFGITYSAWDEVLDIKVAIKEYYPSEMVTRRFEEGKKTKVVISHLKNCDDDFITGKKKVIEEARIMARLRNVSGVVRIFDCFEENSTAYIVMEYIDGCTLEKYLENNKAVNREHLLKSFVPIMEALNQVHKVGIVHRDISPDNIMIDNQGKLTLLDFGASRTSSVDNQRTMTVVLKRKYAPTEQFRQKGVQGPATDVYALGATMYEIIIGHEPPFSLDRSYRDEIKDLRQLDCGIADNIKSAIMVALNVEYSQRWQSMEDFKNAMLDDMYVSESDESGKEKKIIVGLCGFIGMMILFVSIFLIIWANRDGKDKTEAEVLPTETISSETESKPTDTPEPEPTTFMEEIIEDAYFDENFVFSTGKFVVASENNQYMYYGVDSLTYESDDVTVAPGTLFYGKTVSSCVYYDGFFYIDDSSGIYSFNPNTYETKFIISGEGLDFVGIYDKKLYYETYVGQGGVVRLSYWNINSNEFVDCCYVSYSETFCDKDGFMAEAEYDRITNTQYINLKELNTGEITKIKLNMVFPSAELLLYQEPYCLLRSGQTDELFYYNTATGKGENLGKYYTYCIQGNNIYYMDSEQLYVRDLISNKTMSVCDISPYFNWYEITQYNIGMEYIEINGEKYIYASKSLDEGCLVISLDTYETVWNGN